MAIDIPNPEGFLSLLLVGLLLLLACVVANLLGSDRADIPCQALADFVAPSA